MTIEFDHVFIFTSVDAPEAEQVLAIGLTEGSSSIHPGQGTANRRIFFHNAMLEFLWVCEAQEVQSAPIQPTQLWQRSHYQQTGFSPFGLGFRFQPHVKPADRTLPFESWGFRPPYLPPHLQFEVASHTTPAEPMIFVMPFEGTRPDTLPADRRQPLEHAIGFREMTGLHLVLPALSPFSPAVQALPEMITFTTGEDHCIEIEFDRGAQGQAIDFRPSLPLRFRW